MVSVLDLILEVFYDLEMVIIITYTLVMLELLRDQFHALEKEIIPDQIYSNMIDWNPTEIIGKKPTPFACSMYQSLFLNECWGFGRDFLGYNKISRSNFSVKIGNTIYINCIQSYLSLLPDP